MYPTQDEHYFLLEEKEWEVMADCGCQIAVEEDVGTVRLYHCSLHAAAAELLEATEGAVVELNRGPMGRSREIEAVIRRAKGEEV